MLSSRPSDADVEGDMLTGSRRVSEDIVSVLLLQSFSWKEHRTADELRAPRLLGPAQAMQKAISGRRGPSFLLRLLQR